jgi:hypothetical protein
MTLRFHGADFDSLVAQCVDWIDMHRAVRRQPAGEQRNAEQQERNTSKRERIRGFDFEEQPSHQPGRAPVA